MKPTDCFSKAFLKSVHRFPGGFGKTFSSSNAALEQLLTLQQESLGKSVKILKPFARGRIKLVN
jgi:hypothetical protein